MKFRVREARRHTRQSRADSYRPPNISAAARRHVRARTKNDHRSRDIELKAGVRYRLYHIGRIVPNSRLSVAHEKYFHRDSDALSFPRSIVFRPDAETSNDPSG